MVLETSIGLLSHVIRSSTSDVEKKLLSFDRTAAPPPIIITAITPIAIPTNFLFIFLLVFGFASIYSVDFSSSDSFTGMSESLFSRSIYSLSYFSKDVSFPGASYTSVCFVTDSGIVSNVPQLLQKLFPAEFS